MTREQILAEFVTKDPSRPNLITPWNVGDFCYATDGRSLVEMAGNIEMTEDGLAATRPRVRELFDEQSERFNADRLWLPVSAIENSICDVSCDACDGTGAGYAECQECGGKGEVVCPTCDHEHECKDCDGYGRRRQVGTRCDVCEGGGVVPGYRKEINTPCGVFQGYLLARVALLPCAEYQVPTLFSPLEIMVIRFNYGRCLLMPYRVDDFSGARAMHAAVMEGAA